jgi:hypothetical protein
MPWVPLPGGEDVDAFVRQFKKQSRFLIDEDITAELTACMRSEGYNVTSAIDEGLAGSSDDEVFQYARREKRGGRGGGHRREVDCRRNYRTTSGRGF